jgi:hypothetical protein
MHCIVKDTIELDILHYRAIVHYLVLLLSLEKLQGLTIISKAAAV